MTRIEGLAEIAPRFDALIVDQFGVLHDGTHAYPDAPACVDRLTGAGKQLVVLSNSGRRATANRERLAKLGFRVDALHAVITSGEVAWHALAERADAFHRSFGRRCYVIAESGVAQFLHGLDLVPVVTADAADFVLLIGIDTPRRSLDDYMPALRTAARRHLPLLCANSDQVRLTPEGLQPAPGALARRYEALGGYVRWYGKPLPAIFESCLATLNGIDRSRVLVVGDSLEHDVAGARKAGLATAYIRGGIGEGESPSALAASIAASGTAPDFVAERFRW
jgi:HAD superfamily hydrolase (TIGR01459 family)